MLEQSPQSPEARRIRREGRDANPVWVRAREVARRVAVGVYTDGFIHAGNLAYLTLVALFPFFIVAAAIAQIFGRTADGLAAVNAFLVTVPRGVADVLRPAITDVLEARTGHLLWIGALVGLWTVGSLIETIRDILRRAYGTRSTMPFWKHRLSSIGIIVASVLAALLAFSLQVILVTAEAVLHRFFPLANDALNFIGSTRLVPTCILYVAMFFLFAALTPSRYRGRAYPKWPGALVTTLWWYGTTLLLPVFLAGLGGYSLTYGGLAGAMITLIFFFVIGLGVVIGAELNAALVEEPAGDDQPDGDIVTP
jgi:membrane protein